MSVEHSRGFREPGRTVFGAGGLEDRSFARSHVRTASNLDAEIDPECSGMDEPLSGEFAP